MDRKSVVLIDKAINAVADHVKSWYHGSPPKFTVHVTWFCKTLQNWKGLLITDLPDNKFYEVTYDGDKDVMYIDVYEKTLNVEVRINEGNG